MWPLDPQTSSTGRKQAEKATQPQTEAVFYWIERVVQKMEPKAQSTLAKATENHKQGEVLGPNQGNKSRAWVDFRIAVDPWLRYCCLFSLFWTGIYCGYPIPVSLLYMLGMWEHVTCLFSWQVVRQRNHTWGAVPKKLHLRNFICTWTWFIREDPGVWVDAEMEFDFETLGSRVCFAFGRNVNCCGQRATGTDYIFQR